MTDLWLRYTWPRRLVERAGAPKETWHHFSCNSAPEAVGGEVARPGGGGGRGGGEAGQGGGGGRPHSRRRGLKLSPDSGSLLTNAGANNDEPAPAGAQKHPGGGPAPGRLGLTVAWRRKPPTRVPEALWLRFRPGPGADAGSWRLSKLGSEISPLEVSATLWCGAAAAAAHAKGPAMRTHASGGGGAGSVPRVHSIPQVLEPPTPIGPRAPSRRCRSSATEASRCMP